MRLATVACAALVAAAGMTTGCSDNTTTRHAYYDNGTERSYSYRAGERYYNPDGRYYDSVNGRYYDRISYDTTTTSRTDRTDTTYRDPTYRDSDRNVNDRRYWDTTRTYYDRNGRPYEPWYSGDRTDRTLDSDSRSTAETRYNDDSRSNNDRYYNDRYNSYGERREPTWYNGDRPGDPSDFRYDRTGRYETTYDRYNSSDRSHDRWDYDRDNRYNSTYQNDGRRYEPWYTGDRSDRSLDRDTNARTEVTARDYDTNNPRYRDDGTRYDTTRTTTTSQQTKKVEGCDPALVMNPNDFITKMSNDGKVEVEVSRIASRQAENAKVRQFAKRMVDDHTRLDEDLTKLASSEGVTLQTDVIANNRTTINRLSSLSGQQFDREYMEMMIKDHMKCAKKFEQMAQNGTDPEVRAFAERHLPTLREHLRLAKDIGNDLGIHIEDSQLSGVDTEK